MDIQFEEANLNSFQLNQPTQLATSSASTGSLTSSSKTIPTNNYSSSGNLINLDLMPQTSSTHLPISNDFNVPVDSSLTLSAFTTSSSSPRKEGKALNSAFLRNANRHPKHTNAYQISKPNSLKQKRSAYSSRYALSLMDLFTSSNNVPNISRSVNRCTPSFTAQTNAIISHVPACTVSSVYINHNVAIGMMLSILSIW